VVKEKPQAVDEKRKTRWQTCPWRKIFIFTTASHLVCSFESFKMNHQVNKENVKGIFTVDWYKQP
jgi:hypothetical protein